MASYRGYLEEGLDPSSQMYAPVPVAKAPAFIRPESASSDFPHNDTYSPPRPPSPDCETSISAAPLTFPDYISGAQNPFNFPPPTSRSTPTLASKPSASLYSCDTSSNSAARQPHRLQVRGIIHSAGADSPRWLEATELILQYRFHSPDLLEEALESPGSGASCVGASHRHLGREGNAGLAGVGRRAMELVLREECYRGKVEEKEAARMIGRVLGWRNLLVVGEGSKLERFVRGRESGVRSRAQILKMLREDVKTEDASRTVARGVCAVLGAVYYDGGIESVAKVMGTLKIKILEK